MPKITVLMPVYNAEKYLKEAIDSILKQTYKDFEFLIINDGSTDNSQEIIDSFNDPRIKSIINPENLKLIATLNKGLSLATGEYIARMDSDDISHPKRLETQLKFMEKNSQVAVVGSSVKIIGKPFYKTSALTSYRRIKNYLCVNNCFIHPTTMIRKSVLIENNYLYEKEYIHAEDYAFFQRISEKYPVANINKALLYYRLSPEGISRQYYYDQQKMVSKISAKALNRLGLNFSKEEYNKQILDKSDVLKAKEHLESAYSNLVNKDVNTLEVVNWLWLDLCKSAVKHGSWTCKVFHSFKFLETNLISKKILFKFYSRCIRKK